MKRFVAVAVILLTFVQAGAQPGLKKGPKSAASLDYFFLAGKATFNRAVPTPQEVLRYDVGERLVEWGDVLRYVDVLDRVSDRVSVKQFGKTFEDRPFIQVYITSPANQARLETIRKEHLKVTDSRISSSLVLDKMPLIVNVMSTIHGDEASGVNALVALMYYYAACEDNTVCDMLDNMVLIFTPGQNPDGLNRYAANVNGYASYNPYVVSLVIKEQSLPWPSNRYNHYWMDVNRDWLTAQMPEGQNLVRMYEYWMPNVVLDLHEEWSYKSGEYYFSPGDANKTHYCIPQKNQDLTEKISAYTQHAVDSLGITYFSKKGYDDFFIGKGACYGDVQGSVCILHEQVGTYGHVRDIGENGIRKFIETVRNQSIATMAVVNGSYDLRYDLKEYQRDFYVASAREAASDKNRGYIFSARGNRGTAYHFIENLLLHEIDVYPVEGTDGKWFVPFEQKHYKKVRTIFDDITEYSVKTFYDVSTWGPAYGYNITKELVAATPATGPKITVNSFPKGGIAGGRSAIGYVFNLSEYYTPYMISALQKAGVAVKVAVKPFNYRYKVEKIERSYPAGTVVIPVEGQTLSSDEIYAAVSEQASKCAVTVDPLQSDKRRGFDLRSVRMADVRDPKVLITTDIGPAGSIGEIWYILDYRYDMRHYLIDFRRFGSPSFSLDDYDVIILTGDELSRRTNPLAYDNLEKWVRNGGTLILQQAAFSVSEKIGLPKFTMNEAKGVSGLILNADVCKADSPLLWGYDQTQIPVFKRKAETYNIPDRATAVLSFGQDPYLTGYVSDQNMARFKGSPVVATMPAGKGNVVFFAENMNFRSYWYATTHLLTNAIFFGNLL